MTSPESVLPLYDLVVDVIIVGAGFGGCYALHEMRRQGYTAKILEAGGDFGGVWHFNRYPGVRVDSETPLYQLSLSNVTDSFNFTERFPDGEELRRYFDHLNDTLDLRKDAIFNTKVSGVHYDQVKTTWSFSTDSGLCATSRYAIFASGSTNKAFIPNFSGIERFTGPIIHPSVWPEDLDITGKKIGIIGQGASGIQILQTLAKQDCKITVFIRNPCTAIPMGQRVIPTKESEGLKNLYDTIFTRAKYGSPVGTAYNRCKVSYHDLSEEERNKLYEKLWKRGGYAFLSSNLPEYIVNKQANADVYDFWVNKVRARMADPVKRDIVAPLQQFQWIGTKRPSLEMDYYEMIDRPNVSLVNLKSTPIKEFTNGGITTVDGKAHKLDIVIVATGYDSVTGSLYDMNITDKEGVSLRKKWQDGIKTYLGMMVPGLPNAFFLYGPQAPTSLANGPPFLELQVEWVTAFLKKMKSDKLKAVEVSNEAAEEWGQASLKVFNILLNRETPSWWNGANIPGKRREPLIWHGGIPAWWQECSNALADWSKFTVSK
ncbi:hypothetical protein G7Z17_g3307 [Cylindrodendrum hubeiense]|uniref:FAD/NAD(P)-binding domain-containing protein n=1 Tax=Cylindrodendrum hubeiense TaxID=595255 RepID=A0A9P5LDQ5_9HYPO|nr:hypothetical protein G7Z17_g3307 [Cylindrodendrum hubeiense]